MLSKIFRESIIKVGGMLTDCYSTIMLIQNVGEEGMQVVLIRLERSISTLSNPTSKYSKSTPKCSEFH
jgi:hypothetical protein